MSLLSLKKQHYYCPKCVVCGRFISYADLASGRAVNRMVTPDSEFTWETFEAYCPKHNPKETVYEMDVV